MENKVNVKAMIAKIEKDFEKTCPRLVKQDAVKTHFGLLVLSSILTTQFMKEVGVIFKDYGMSVTNAMLVNVLSLNRDTPAVLEHDDLLKEYKDMIEDNEEFKKFMEIFFEEKVREGEKIKQAGLSYNSSDKPAFSKAHLEKIYNNTLSKYISRSALIKEDAEHAKRLELALINFGRFFTVQDVAKYLEDSGYVSSFDDEIEIILNKANDIMEDECLGKYFSVLRGQDYLSGVVEEARYFNIVILRVLLEELGEDEMVNYNINTNSFFYQYTAGKGYVEIMEKRKNNSVNIMHLKNNVDLTYKGEPLIKNRLDSSFFRIEKKEWTAGEIAMCVVGGLVGLYAGALVVNAIRNPEFGVMDVIDYTNNSILDIFGLGYNKFV